MVRTVKLALLICDTPIPSVVSEHGDYLSIFHRFLKSSLPSNDVEFTLDGFDVVHKREYPTEDQLVGEGRYRGIIITGSAASAYAPLPWIPPLLSFISSTVTSHPEVKLIGICFGHQVIARAYGGDCVPNEKGWEVGVYDVKLTDLGKKIFEVNGSNDLRIQQMHRDHVPALPPSFHLLGSTPIAPIQGMLLPAPYHSSSRITPNDVQILCVQGHPEFLSDIVSKVVDAREKSGAMGPEVVKDGRARAGKLHDGVGVIGKTVWKVLGVA